MHFIEMIGGPQDGLEFSMADQPPDYLDLPASGEPLLSFDSLSALKQRVATAFGKGA